MVERRDGTRLRGILATAIRILPADHRESIGDDLLDCLLDCAGDRRRAAGVIGLTFFVLRALVDIAWDAIALRCTSPAPSGRRSSNIPRSIMNRILEDLRIASRTLSRRPSFLAVVVITLGLGLGASTTVFGILDAVFLRPLPYPESERMVMAGARFGDVSVSSLSYRAAEALHRQPELDAVVTIGQRTQVLGGRDEPVRLQAAMVDVQFFDLLGVVPEHGRIFADADNAPAAPPVALLSHGAWQRVWARDQAVVGKTIQIEDRPTTVVGVLSEGFLPPEAIFGQETVDVWLPIGVEGAALELAEDFRFQVLARRAEGTSLDRARHAADQASRQFAEQYPAAAEWSGKPVELWVDDLRARTVGEQGNTTFLLIGTVGFLLLIACANVASLFLARGTDRYRELTLRSALGASRTRLVRLLLIEHLVTALGGAAVGLLLALGGVRAFVALSPGDIPRLREVAVDPRVAGFALLLALSTGVAFGLFPALRVTGGLGAARRALSGGTTRTSDRRTGRLRSGLVIAQTAIALVLATGAGLMVNSLTRIVAADPGFDPAGRVSLRIAIEGDTKHAWRTVQASVLSELEAAPGLEHVATMVSLPMANRGMWTNVRGGTGATLEEPLFIRTNLVSPNWAKTLGVELLAGRDVEARDREDAPNVVVVNETLARRFWGEESALGEVLQTGAAGAPRSQRLTVIGVVADIKQRALHRPPEPEMYRPFAQQSTARIELVAHSDLPTEVAVMALRDVLRRVDPKLVPEGVRDLESMVAASVGEPRFYTAVLTSVALAALVLALIGVFASMSYRVARRVREVGIRVALGAGQRQVVGMIVRHGLRVAGIGLGLGLLASWYLSRFLDSFVYGIGTHDLVTFASVTLLILFGAGVACYVPARRAARVDPVRVLRSE